MKRYVAIDICRENRDSKYFSALAEDDCLLCIGESGATFHRGKLLHSHFKSRTLIVIDFTEIVLHSFCVFIDFPEFQKHCWQSFHWFVFAFSLLRNNLHV